MEWYHIIIEVVFPLIGLIGGGVGIFYWREYKALKQKEVESAAIDNELKQAEAWQRLFENECKRTKEKSERLKELYLERDGLKEQLNKSRFRVEQLCWYHCTMNACRNRKPPHRFDEQGNEINAAIFDEEKDNL